MLLEVVVILLLRLIVHQCWVGSRKSPIFVGERHGGGGIDTRRVMAEVGGG